MSDNRYVARQKRRQERQRQWLFDKDMRLNDEIDRRDRRVRLEQRERDEQRRGHMLVNQ